MLLFWHLIFYSLVKCSICINFCAPGSNTCHDGGCVNSVSKNSKTVCNCDLSKSVMSGTYCGNYENKCLINPCKNNGLCKSGMGHHICECSENFHGTNCEIPLNPGKFIEWKFLICSS